MGRFIGVLVIVVVAIVALGFYLDWWRINQTTEGDDVDITLSVDKKKIRKDTGTAVEQVRKVGQDASEQVAKIASRDSVRGKVTAVNVDDGIITLSRDDGETMSLHTTESTSVRRSDEALSVRDVPIDQPVTVEYTTEDGKHIARSITFDAK